MKDSSSRAETISRLTMAAFVAQQAWQIGSAWGPKAVAWWKRARSRELIVKSDCPFYHDVLLWLVQKNAGRKKTRSLEIVGATSNSPVEVCSGDQQGDEEGPGILLVPGVNQPTEFLFRGCKVSVTRTDNSQSPGNEKQARFVPDTITIRVETASEAITTAIVEEIKEATKKRRTRGINVRIYQWSSWRLLHKVDWGDRQAILPEGRYDESDLDWFLHNHAWYKHRGIPYQRGYLFHGSAGNGKTTSAITLATAFGLDLCLLNLGSRMMTDETLQEAVGSMPNRAALLLEDIDCAFDERKAEGGNLTFSGVLNALDGAMSTEGRVAFITTNHLERLDSALLRPGRVDRRVLVSNPDTSQIGALVRRFYPEMDAINYPKFQGKSMAEIQEILVREAMEARP